MYTDTGIHICMYTYTCVYVYTHIYKYENRYIYTNIHTFASAPVRLDEHRIPWNMGERERGWGERHMRRALWVVGLCGKRLKTCLLTCCRRALHTHEGVGG